MTEATWSATLAELILRQRRLQVKGRATTLPPVRPNAGLRAVYRARLEAAVQELHNSVLYWLKAAWRQQPRLAQDAPVADLRDLFRRLGRRWERRFNELAPELAAYFAQKASDRVSGKLRELLKERGMSVEFVMSRPVRLAYQAVLAENVGLIKSIAREHLGKVEGEVMRSVAAGRDLATLTTGLQAQYGLTRRRAALVARDQNNKATAVITKARQLELGVTHARWRHSHGGQRPRPSHVEADGTVYEIERGWWDPDERAWVWPGTLINCRCVSEPVIPGF